LPKWPFPEMSSVSEKWVVHPFIQKTIALDQRVPLPDGDSEYLVLVHDIVSGVFCYALDSSVNRLNFHEALRRLARTPPRHIIAADSDGTVLSFYTPVDARGVKRLGVGDDAAGGKSLAERLRQRTS